PDKPGRKQDSRYQQPDDDESGDAHGARDNAADELAAILIGDAEVGRQPFLAGQIDGQPEHHYDARAAEAVVPPDLLPERARYKRCRNHADVDEDVEDLER